jgi:transposase
MSSHYTQQSIPLPDAPADERVFLNPSLWMIDRDGHRVIFCRHEPIYRIPLGDELHLRMVAVTLRISKLATQEEIAGAFGHSVATQRRWESEYQEHDIEGLKRKRNPGRPSQLDKTQRALIRRWFEAGVSKYEMGRRLEVDESVVRRALKRLGLRRPKPPAPQLPCMDEAAQETLVADVSSKDASTKAPATHEEQGAKSGEAPVVEPSHQIALSVVESTETLQPTVDQNPLDRSGDRALARVGLLEDARPLFADADALPRAGVLLAIPLLEKHGLLSVFQRVYRSLGPAFYGLRTTVVVLFLCALLRIKRPEQLKEYRPQDLGRIVGLDRMPEVKTVRRKFTRLAVWQRAKQLMEELARARINEDLQRIAFLYLDGHVREYHGKYRLGKAKKPQRQVVTRAATDTWVHDANGEPLLVVTSEMNAKLTQVLEPILEDVKRLVPEGQRITIIFDRGGFSVKLFQRLIQAGFDVITYRKGKIRKMPSSMFQRQRQKIDGQWREYELCDRPRVRVGRLRPKRRKDQEKPQYLWMREVRVLREDGRQTPVLTTRTDLQGVEVPYRMFRRWRQENYLQYMMEEFALDALVEYGAEDVSEVLDHPNPKWARLSRRLKAAKAEVKRLRAELGAAVAENEESTRRTVRGFKIAHAELRAQLEQAEARVQRLFEQRKKIPKRIPADDLETLKKEKKLIADAIKMAAYHVETELLGMLQEHYPRAADEGRTLLSAAFQSSARIEVTDDELRVTIASQASPHRTAALAALCRDLNAQAAHFPGTRSRIRLAVSDHEPLT